MRRFAILHGKNMGFLVNGMYTTALAAAAQRTQPKGSCFLILQFLGINAILALSLRLKFLELFPCLFSGVVSSLAKIWKSSTLIDLRREV
jgi:hypothetical protein